ncbi:SDR family NAD(P)-dependent oxidoreductase [Kutzneria sp. CA-103260]|uniref:SDR family NAD(P)-dependent oxidoreductase n=1 Tax=Kutzneria sp. CA-103260 TaxID=2802641 RepID=UPI001BA5FAE1|nr:SDR family oxidoreductase [Kutzneria sp. CA-103260]QUQ67445.1 3-oxoacyl-ACP reductase [Kutzneria sp. CA-103260]
MTSLHDRTALITGGSKGIGRGIAAAMAAAGARVVVNYGHDRRAAEETVAAIGDRAVAVQGDVGDAADVRRMFDTAGPVDILVNNAAVFSFQPIGDVTEKEFRRQYDTNVLGPFLTIQEYLRQAPERGGSIINVTTAGVDTNNPGSALYTSTKAALTSLTRIAAQEFGPKGIRVNAIAPGATETEGAAALGVLDSGAMAARSVFGRAGTPADIGPVAVFLASEDARWITGEVVHASGGFR